MIKTLKQFSKAQIMAWLDAIKDPEIPVISIADLGVLYDVQVEKTTVEVSILPTYSGCPAMDSIQEDIIKHLQKQGIEQVRVKIINSPA